MLNHFTTMLNHLTTMLNCPHALTLHSLRNRRREIAQEEKSIKTKEQEA
jgi:hypothetical protein